MRYAETGFNLEVDLTRGSIERVATDPRDTELLLGGLGTNARLMWDRVPPEVEPFSAENLLVFGTGLLAGTPAPGCNRTIVSAISPQTKLFAYLDHGRVLGTRVEARGVRQGRHPRQVPRVRLSLDQRRQGGTPRRQTLPGARHAGDRGTHPPGTARADGPGGLDRPGRREPGLLRLHRAGQVERQPAGPRRRHGGQAPQGDRRAREEGHQHRQAGDVHRSTATTR